jgi:DNA-binding transcriptional MerR regulator
MSVSMLPMPTVGEISRRLGVPVHRVEYVIQSRNIRPSSRAANLRVFSESDVQHIGSELRRIDADKWRKR